MDFEDLFDRPIPREDAEAFLPALRKIAKKENETPDMTGEALRGAGYGAGAGAGATLGASVLNKSTLGAWARGDAGGALLEGAARAVRHGRYLVPAGAAVGAGVGVHRAKEQAKAIRRGRSKRASLEDKLAAVQAIADALGEEPTPEEIVAREQQGQLEQALAENEHLHEELEAAQGIVQEHAAAAEDAQGEAQMMQEQQQQADMASQEAQAQASEQLMAAQQQLDEAQMQLQEAQGQLQQTQMEAQTQATNAAAQADGKMRLAIRIQQIRQQLAQMAAEDPVAEEGEQADPLMTPGQMGQDPASAGMDPAAAAAGGDPAAAAAAGADPAAGAAPGAAPPDAAAAGAPPGAAPGGPPAGGAAPKKKSAPKKKEKDDDKKDDSKGGDKPTNKIEIKTGALLARAYGLLEAEKEAGIVNTLKKPFARGAELFTGSRIHRLERAADGVRNKGVRIAAGIQPDPDAFNRSQKLLDQAGKLQRAAGREKTLHKLTVGGTIAAGTGSGYEMSRRHQEPHQRKQMAEEERQAARKARRGKTKRAFDKQADAARMARMKELMERGVQKGLKAVKGVGPAAKATTHHAPTPSKVTGIVKHVPTSQGKSTEAYADAVFNKGDRIPWNTQPPKGPKKNERAAEAYDRWRAAKNNARAHGTLNHLPSDVRHILAGGATVGAVGGEIAHQRNVAKKDQARRKAASFQKIATEAQVRSDAHHAAGKANVIPGALAGYALGHLGSKSKAVRAGVSAAGGSLGYMQGRAGFSKRELANDFHMERALTKARRDRAEKALEKGAGVKDWVKNSPTARKVIAKASDLGLRARTAATNYAENVSGRAVNKHIAGEAARTVRAVSKGRKYTPNTEKLKALESARNRARAGTVAAVGGTGLAGYGVHRAVKGSTDAKHAPKQKKASYELAEHDIDALYGLGAP